MDGILHNNLRRWFRKAFAQLKLDGLAQDIHVDEFFSGDYEALSKNEVLYRSYQVFDCLIRYLINHNISIDNFGLFLSVDLVSESNVLQGMPNSLAETEALLDMFSIPEIILHHDTNPNKIPLVELYRVLILCMPYAVNNNIKIFYREIRTLQDHISNGDYIREINFIYSPESA